MSQMGQKRRFGSRPVTSGRPRQADVRSVRRHVSNVLPGVEVAINTLTQIFGAKSARSKTDVFSRSSDLAADGVSSAACRKASAVASRPSTVSFAWLPESCGREGICSPVSIVLGSRLFCGMIDSLDRPIQLLESGSAGHHPERDSPGFPSPICATPRGDSARVFRVPDTPGAASPSGPLRRGLDTEAQDKSSPDHHIRLATHGCHNKTFA